MVKILDCKDMTCAVWDDFPAEGAGLLDCKADFVECWLEPGQTTEKQWLEKNGFYFLERFLDCRIMLRNLPEKPKRMRYETGIGQAATEELQKVYYAAFTQDRRMHLGQGYEQNLANRLIDYYIREAQSENMVLLECRYKKQLAGCAFLREADSAYEVYLAAVLPLYQKTGMAVELYRACADFAAEAGKRMLTGRISAANTDVMNLYARLGAAYYHPRDVYARDQREK